jgi:hypothetical protein
MFFSMYIGITDIQAKQMSQLVDKSSILQHTDALFKLGIQLYH